VCPYNREHLFGQIVDDEMRPKSFGRIAQSAWEELPCHYPDVELDAFVVMPNHVHGIIVILANDVAEANPVGAEVRDGLVGAIHELSVRARLVGPYGNRPKHHARAGGQCCWGRSLAGSR
jgi:hypothetical protein